MYRVVIITALGLLAGCAAPNTELRDQPQIERLRIQISKARNAIAETRTAIAEARGAPHLAELYVRLAELLSDEAKYHYQVAYEREQRSGKSLHVPQVRFLKEQAIGLYKEILSKYPKTPLAPRILFNMGQEQRELGNYKEMRAALEQLARMEGEMKRLERLVLASSTNVVPKSRRLAPLAPRPLDGELARASSLDSDADPTPLAMPPSTSTQGRARGKYRIAPMPPPPSEHAESTVASTPNPNPSPTGAGAGPVPVGRKRLCVIQ